MIGHVLSDRLQSAGALAQNILTRLLQCACDGRMSQGVAEEISHRCVAIVETVLRASGVVAGSVKIVRCVWVVRRIDVTDQGIEVRGTELELGQYASHGEAVASLERWATRRENGTWVPLKRDHDWQVVDVVYREKKI